MQAALYTSLEALDLLLTEQAARAKLARHRRVAALLKAPEPPPQSVAVRHTLHLPTMHAVRHYERIAGGWVAAVPMMGADRLTHVRIWTPPVLVAVRRARAA